jgi:hypothetical protein
MRDLQSSRAIWIKGGLFLFIGIVSALLILIETAFLLAMTIWGFCRCYYFIFYVIERWVDPGYKFSGLGSFVVYALKRRK